MKNYFVILPTLSGTSSYNYAKEVNPIWGNSEKRKLDVNNLEEAKIEGKQIFLQNRSHQFIFIADNLNEANQKILKKTFPKKIVIIEEIEHQVTV